MDKAQLGQEILKYSYLEGDFTLRSGQKSKYYLDKYLFETQAHLLDGITSELVKLLPTDYDLLAGPELGAIALVAVASVKTGKPFVIVRKGEKGYGTSKLLEGSYSAGQRVVILEDILTTAGAAIEAAQKLTTAGLKVIEIIGVIDREQGATENARKAGFAIRALFTKSELGI